MVGDITSGAPGVLSAEDESRVMRMHRWSLRWRRVAGSRAALVARALVSGVVPDGEWTDAQRGVLPICPVVTEDLRVFRIAYHAQGAWSRRADGEWAARRATT
jgi:hypothetical protein